MFIEIHCEQKLFDSSWSRISKYAHCYKHSNPLGLYPFLDYYLKTNSIDF